MGEQRFCVSCFGDDVPEPEFACRPCLTRHLAAAARAVDAEMRRLSAAYPDLTQVSVAGVAQAVRRALARFPSAPAFAAALEDTLAALEGVQANGAGAVSAVTRTLTSFAADQAGAAAS